MKKPSQYTGFFGQAGIGLPHRDNYFSMDEEDIETSIRYVELK